jgi:hypothetical protein
MTLLDFVQSLEDLDGDLTLYARKPWTEASPAVAEVEPQDGALPEAAIREELAYFLEVSIAREFVQDWEQWLQAKPSATQRCARLIEYAKNDA